MLVTTRRRDAVLTGPGQRLVTVGLLTALAAELGYAIGKSLGYRRLPGRPAQPG
ncbi:hypothetical protein ABR737_09645 [Streptomyces sp. Edi2]|uniref:hypothetical protein n=1 Tax=Streptomyces sp. Edi2 TaxID=3162528 RepID=UPI00330608B0